jgi:hypothetical protein
MTQIQLVSAAQLAGLPLQPIQDLIELLRCALYPAVRTNLAHLLLDDAVDGPVPGQGDGAPLSPVQVEFWQLEFVRALLSVAARRLAMGSILLRWHAEAVEASTFAGLKTVAPDPHSNAFATPTHPGPPAWLRWRSFSGER